MTATKFLECDWTLTDEEAKAQGRITVSQEWAIQRALEEQGGSDGVLIGDDPGFGKTVIGTEIALRSSGKRGLFIALPDTHDQWYDCIVAQSDGQVVPLVMNGADAEGRENFARFRRGEPGFYIAGSAFLTTHDWESRRVPNPAFRAANNPRNGAGYREPRYVFKRVKTSNPSKGLVKGDLILKERKAAAWRTTAFTLDTVDAPVAVETAKQAGMIGPAAEPVLDTQPHHREIYRRAAMKKNPLDFIVFDEVQAIANKWSQGNRTVRSMGDAFKVSMSGTWFLNEIDNMWTIARYTWPGLDEDGNQYVVSNHEMWREEFLTREVVLDEDGDPVYRGGKVVKKIAGEKEPGAFVDTLPCYIRRETSEQPPEPEIIYVDPTPQQAAQMEELKADLMTWVDNWQGQEEPLVVDIPSQLHMRLRQLTIAELSLDDEGGVFFADTAASAKLTPIRALLEQVWAGQNVAIFTDSKIGAKFLERRMRAAGVDARAWHGDKTKTERRALKKQFLAGEFPYLISTIQSFGTGLDGFQKVCDKVIWISEADGNPALNRQAIARYFRPGRLKRAVLRQDPVTGIWGDALVDDFVHAKIVMRNSVDVESLQSLIHKSWVVRSSLALTTAA